MVIGAAIARDQATWNILAFIAGTYLWMSIRTAFELRFGQGVSATDKQEKLLLGGVFLGMIIVPFAAIATPIFEFAEISLPIGVHIGGVLLLLIGVVVFAFSHLALGRQWSVSLEIKGNHRLISQGVYKWVRHPMYTSIFLITVAQCLLLDNWFAGPAGFASFTTLYLLRIGREEAMLAGQFGRDWQTYAAATPRLIPNIRITRRLGRAFSWSVGNSESSPR
ncbi:MAG: protein-S-isoprenylcysteine O-methyltransferase [Pseudomonadota bacterium]